MGLDVGEDVGVCDVGRKEGDAEVGLRVVGDSVGVVVGRVDGLLEGEEEVGLKEEGVVVDFVGV